MHNYFRFYRSTNQPQLPLLIILGLILGVIAAPALAGAGSSDEINWWQMGMQLFGARGADAQLLSMSEAYHQATNWPEQRPPVL